MKFLLKTETIKNISGFNSIQKLNNFYILSNPDYSCIQKIPILPDDTFSKRIIINFDAIKKLLAFKTNEILEFELEEDKQKLVITDNKIIEKINYLDADDIPSFYINIIVNLIDNRILFENSLQLVNKTNIKKGYIVLDKEGYFNFDIDSDNNYIYREINKADINLSFSKGSLTGTKIFEYDESMDLYYFYLGIQKEYLSITDMNVVKRHEYNSSSYNHFKNFLYVVKKLSEVTEEDKSFILNYEFELSRDIINKIQSILNDKQIINNQTYITLNGKTFSIYDSMFDTNIFTCEYICKIDKERIDIPYKLYKNILKYGNKNIKGVYKYNKYFLIILQNDDKILVNV